jgi:protein gp37
LIFDSYCKALENCKLFIIGAETGTRKDKVVPKKEWVDNIVKFCNENKIKVFMKESLREIMGNDFRQDKLIWEIGE